MAAVRAIGENPLSARWSDIVVGSARDHDIAVRRHLADDLHDRFLRLVDVAALDHRHPAHLVADGFAGALRHGKSEEHTSELQLLMRIFYAVFFLKTKHKKLHSTPHPLHRHLSVL